MFSGWLSCLLNGLDISWCACSCKYLDWVLYRVICRLGTVTHRVYHSILRKARPRQVPMKYWDTSTARPKRRGSRAKDHTIKCLPDSGLNGSGPSRTRSASHPIRLWTTNANFPQILRWISFQIELQTIMDLSHVNVCLSRFAQGLKLAFASEETISYLLLDRLQFKRCMLGKNDVWVGSYLFVNVPFPALKGYPTKSKGGSITKKMCAFVKRSLGRGVAKLVSQNNMAVSKQSRLGTKLYRRKLFGHAWFWPSSDIS